MLNKFLPLDALIAVDYNGIALCLSDLLHDPRATLDDRTPLVCGELTILLSSTCDQTCDQSFDRC